MQAVHVTTAFANGLFMSLVLIVAIGAQNAYVLRQGLRREHVGAVVLFCAASDAVLIGAGVAGMAQVLQGRPMLATVLAGLGAAFLCAYGLRALWRSRQPAALQATAQGASSLSRAAVVAQAAGFTLLNPHVYLDTVLLVGSAGAQYAGMLKVWFVAGASAASVLWFTSLGFGARLLAPVFARPRAWQMLDALVGGTMLVLAAMLARRALTGA
ncbi:LysE/ArgO family amino acid transporter [Variovorax sp. NFACC27]|uniref:LysE/ArgO family amino acid transporter n=1 Tax=unclassified Variovorax TaxID=663243 RepID=UPI000895CD73|nr:LysE/ArgO family amino acid transporter [Variovorax sp. YR750]SEF29079.1 L-lysine exporter family protein LysE/ArgO [Variovorax sp. NFACC28]SEG92374.1 L-lysine exporter family protein LysE/ArgO [Variovorax sp. NFACC29]SFD64424.1 L-lysine exporter family protein LysE/ArgO [Variovorax sp. NFACC26]SFG98775.1 L-lysine exporter family protein LysE/ArgO [Variovorax sp. NFACC27]SEM18087.1 L-lysine exporter family protein LysE/ArgO [Variovorax sp. YR750]